MNTITNRTWKKIAAFAMSLTIMCGVGAVMGRTTGATFVTSAAEEQVTEAFEIQTCEHGKLRAELVENDNQEFDAVLVTPEADEGYKVAAVYANGDQVAINDKDQYLIAYNGTKLTLSAEFVKDEDTEDFEIQPCEHGTLHAELIQSTDQEFDAILVTPEPDAGYKVAAVYAGGDQVAINDKDQYLIAYNGEKIILSAEFVKADSSTDSSPKTGAAAAGIGMTAVAAIAAAALIATKKRK